MKATILKMDPRAVNLTFSDGPKPILSVELADGRIVSIPFAWSPRLSRATEQKRNQWQLLAEGELIHWPAVDEDIETEGLLALEEIVVPPDVYLRIKRARRNRCRPESDEPALKV